MVKAEFLNQTKRVSRNYVFTIRLPKELGLGVERYASRTGHKPAHVGAMAVDEFLRRRMFPLIDWRETPAGRVAYVKGTRFAVYWLVDAVRRVKGNLDLATRMWSVSPDKIRAALQYAEIYPEEIEQLREIAAENRAALEKAEAALANAKKGKVPGGNIRPPGKRSG